MKNSDEQIFLRIKELISQVLGVEQDEIVIDSTPDSIAEWTSLRHLEILAALEDDFDLLFGEEESIALLSVGRIFEAVKKKMEILHVSN